MARGVVWIHSAARCAPGSQVGALEYRDYERAVNKEWREGRGAKIRTDARMVSKETLIYRHGLITQ